MSPAGWKTSKAGANTVVLPMALLPRLTVIAVIEVPLKDVVAVEVTYLFPFASKSDPRIATVPGKIVVTPDRPMGYSC